MLSMRSQNEDGIAGSAISPATSTAPTAAGFTLAM